MGDLLGSPGARLAHRDATLRNRGSMLPAALPGSPPLTEAFEYFGFSPDDQRFYGVYYLVSNGRLQSSNGNSELRLGLLG